MPPTLPSNAPEAPRPGPISTLLDAMGPGPTGWGTFAATLLLLLVGWAVAVFNWQDRALHQHQALADQTALRLHDWVGSRLLVLESIRAMRSQGLIVDSRAWRTWVGLDLETIDGFQAINWIDADGVIRVTAPAEGNEGALGKSVPEHPVAGPVFARAQETRRLQASPPLDLFQGGRAFTVYLPVVPLDGTDGGFVNGVFRVDRIVEHALNHLDLSREEVRIHDGTDLLWASGEGAVKPASRGVATLAVAERTWTVEIAPVHPVVPLAWHLTAGLLILLLSGAAGTVAAWSALQARQTALARAEAKRIARRLAEIERMESLGRVAGGIAHDFNNILTVVIGRASDLELRLADAPPEVREGLQAILDAGDRAAKLIEMLLTFARRGDDVVGEVDAAAHLRKMAPMLVHLGGRRVSVKVEVEPDQARLPLSAAAFDRMTINLVTNAVEAIEDRGQVEVRLSPCDEGTCLLVRDDGGGMSPETRARVFEPFYTTKERGTGLGLATVFGLVSQAGGRIEIDSAAGRGTTFRVLLPDADAPTPQGRTGAAGTGATGADRAREGGAPDHENR